ncbi:hypothetical protein GQX74_006583 [Glossina fuscipes]|nr:hypothetical protein GQX74_006583 [Glossina fuscipes]
MHPDKYIQSYKCECFQPHDYCSCPQKIPATIVFIDNVQHTAKSISKVMIICGVEQKQAEKSIDVVAFYFLHYDEIRYHINSVPHKRLNRLDLLHDLSCKCSMARTEIQISYSIIKRAFKAFYYGTDEGGVHNPLLNPKRKHVSDCLWYYAARRTAQIYASYESMFPICQKSIEIKIRVVYLKLSNHIKSSIPYDDDRDCGCLKCFKRILVETLWSASSKEHLPDPSAVYSDKSSTLPGSGIQNEKWKFRATQPQVCDCPELTVSNQDKSLIEIAESLNIGYSQGPFECHWLPISKEEAEADEFKPDVSLPEEFPCPSESTILEEFESEPCDASSCKCTCEICVCGSQEICDEDADVEREVIVDEGTLQEEEEESEITVKAESKLDLSKRMPSKKYSGCHVPSALLSPSELDVFKTKEDQDLNKPRKKSDLWKLMRNVLKLTHLRGQGEQLKHSKETSSVAMRKKSNQWKLLKNVMKWPLTRPQPFVSKLNAQESKELQGLTKIGD